MSNGLSYTSGTLLVFLDETGDESHSDPNFPIFGRGGCVVMGGEYHTRVQRPWKRMLDSLGWGNSPFHTSEFGQRLRALQKAEQQRQIDCLNAMVRHGFFRFGVTTDLRTKRSPGIDPHETVALTVVNCIRRFIRKSTPSSVAFIFEASSRADELVVRDFQAQRFGLIDIFDNVVPFEGFFLPKASRVEGLELADLLSHTAGEQQRHRLRCRPGFHKSFEHAFQSVGDELAYYMSVDSISIGAGQAG